MRSKCRSVSGSSVIMPTIISSMLRMYQAVSQIVQFSGTMAAIPRAWSASTSRRHSSACDGSNSG